MKFLVDAQLPPALARWIEFKGHDANHVANLGLLSATDQEIWDAAVATDAILVTKDRDFVDIAVSRPGLTQVVWVRSGNTKKWILVVNFETSWDAIIEAIDSGAAIIEVG